MRIGALGHRVPSGSITLTGFSKNSSSAIEHQLEWDYTSEKVHEPFNSVNKRLSTKISNKSLSKEKTQTFAKSPFFRKKFSMPQYDVIANVKGRPSDLGAKKSFLPQLGKVLWQAPEDSFFDAYVFAMPNGKRSGFVRIPSYSLSDSELAAQQLMDIIDIFQRKSDVLVIDQVNNPGGFVLYMYALASMLTDKALSVPKHRLMITQEDVYFAITEMPLLDEIKTDEDARNLLGESLMGVPVTCELIEFLKNYAQFLIDEWNDGRQLTQPYYLYGIGPIPPHPQVRYTKPILILVNSLDFSGGDFFPAIFQDNRRAKIMGTRTAGAGGYVASASFRNLNGIANFHYTGSIAERSDQHLIENFGVTPDIPYEISEIDLQNNYVEYVEKILKTLESLTDEPRGRAWKFRLSKKL